MSCQTILGAGFHTLIENHSIVFIDFWAEWCAPCKQFAANYEHTAEQYPQIVFAKINIETEQDTAEYFEIRSIPHLMVFKEGVVIYSNSGSLSASVLNELAEQALQVDMSEITPQQ